MERHGSRAESYEGDDHPRHGHWKRDSIIMLLAILGLLRADALAAVLHDKGK
jgi:hypothetical protein